ncbi:hypothetical protein, partial [Pyramidobacter piscolens]|uniref:hypothetical protein n=1 Tax=Pyramidobacter piscolens TaxID=638849 RepID=UPI003AF901C3
SAGLAVSSPDAAAFHRGHTAVNDLQLMPTSELPFFCLFGLTSLTNVQDILPRENFFRSRLRQSPTKKAETSTQKK